MATLLAHASPTTTSWPIAAAPLRRRVRVRGHVVEQGIVNWRGGPVYYADLEDHTGIVRLAFLGRRGIAGIRDGVALSADGTIALVADRLRILNPLIEVHAADGTTPRVTQPHIDFAAC